MSADNIIYLQRCRDGKWRAWEQGASVDPQRPASWLIVESDSREHAIVTALDWDQKHGTEYGISELDPEPPDAPPPLAQAGSPEPQLKEE